MPNASRPVAVYDYRDEQNHLLYQVCRFKPKRFLRRRPHPELPGEWDYHTAGVRSVLYRLPELLARPEEVVFFVEGEKDADGLLARGYLATTAAGGANTPWNDAFSRMLKDRIVVLLPDNDKPGREFMKSIGEHLWLHTRNCLWCELPALPEKGDVSDWFAAGGTAEQFNDIVAKSPRFASLFAREARATIMSADRDVVATGFRPSDILTLGDVPAQTIGWLWKPWLPEGKLCLVDGDPGQGKSFVTLDIACRLSNGDPFPDGQRNSFGPQNSLLICCEDGLADTVVPRLQCMGADMTRIFGYQGHRVDGIPMSLPQLPGDLPLIRRVIEHTRAKLVVIDPLMAFLGDSVNTVSDASVRQVLTPLAVLADQMRVTVLFVRHLNKTNGKNAVYRGGGSIGITAAMRSAMMIGRHPHDRDKRVMAMVKNNLAEEPRSLEFHLEPRDTGGITVAWDGDTDLLANDLVGDSKGNAVTPRDWLQTILIEPMLAEAVLAQGKMAGYGERVLNNAKVSLDIVSRKRQNKWYWLPVGQRDFPILGPLNTF